MIVIKLGGSLMASNGLLRCLDTIDQKYDKQAVVIVPGGGEFAEQVRSSQRQWGFDDKTAHQMAILAMQQVALLFKALNNHFDIAQSLPAISSYSLQSKTIIWSPDIQELEAAGIPETWDITSDSLAAWLAKALKAQELILVKSVTVDGNWSNHELIAKNIVDRAFFSYVSQASFQWKIVHKDSFTSSS